MAERKDNPIRSNRTQLLYLNIKTDIFYDSGISIILLTITNFKKNFLN